MRVGIFYNSISNPAKFSNKVALMDNFSAGVAAQKDHFIQFRENNLPGTNQQLDAAFVLGYTLEENFRKKIIDVLKSRNVPRIFVDSNILHYNRQEHEWHRYSIDSVYPSSGVYFFEPLNRKKWNTYSSWHGVTLKPWRQSGNHILILCQRPKGWNLMGRDQDEWLDSTISKIRQHSSRPIVVRMHPNDGTRFKQMEKIYKRYKDSISFSLKENIKEELINCWCAVGYNSTPTTVAAIEGIPVYVEDPVNSWAADIAFKDLSLIENPPLPDREEWAHKIANIHWSNEEVRSGKLWSSIKHYISSTRSGI
jgi:hypothetical protein